MRYCMSGHTFPPLAVEWWAARRQPEAGNNPEFWRHFSSSPSFPCWCWEVWAILVPELCYMSYFAFESFPLASVIWISHRRPSSNFSPRPLLLCWVLGGPFSPGHLPLNLWQLPLVSLFVPSGLCTGHWAFWFSPRVLVIFLSCFSCFGFLFIWRTFLPLQLQILLYFFIAAVSFLDSQVFWFFDCYFWFHSYKTFSLPEHVNHCFFEPFSCSLHYIFLVNSFFCFFLERGW